MKLSSMAEGRDLGTVNRGSSYQEDCVGGRIRKRRRELKWSARQLGKRAGISTSFLSDIENSKRGIGANKLLDVARAMNVSLDYLMTGNGGEGGDQDNTPQLSNQLQLPSSLTSFARNADLSFKITILLYQLQQTLNRYKKDGNLIDPEQMDWQMFYEAVKKFL